MGGDLLFPFTKKVALEFPSVRAISSSYWKIPSAEGVRLGRIEKRVAYRQT